MRRVHDMGGIEAGPVDLTDVVYAPWEKRVKAMLQLLVRRIPPVMTLDELRRGIEDLEDYDQRSYYERWTLSICQIMREKGVLSDEELHLKRAAIETRWKEERNG